MGFKTSRTMFNIQTLAIFSTLVAVNVVHSKSAELVSRINRASTDVTVEGWMRGETSIIGAHADEKNFFMEFVATGARFSFLGFQDFFDTFKAGSFEATGWYNVTLYSFMVDNGLAKWGRINNKMTTGKDITFDRKELCNNPDRVCRTASQKA